MAASEFPSPVEREVASALLLLTTTPPSLTLSPPLEKGYRMMENMMMMKEEKMMMMQKKKLRFKISRSQRSSSSLSSSSTVTTKTRSSSENDDDDDDQRLKVIAVVSKSHEMMKFKVVRKRRSKSFSMSDRQKFSCSGKQGVKVEPSASASSCLSSGSSSVISSTGSSGNVNVMNNRRGGGGGGGGRGSYHLFVTPAAKDLKRKPVLGSAHMRRRAEAILKVLSSQGRASEVRIRELLGDSPSTSKALRILLNLEQVKRSGAGGRTDPYIYMLSHAIFSACEKGEA